MQFFDLNNKPIEYTGTPIEWRISGYGAVKNDKNEVLLVIPTWRETYDFPGGGVETTESISEGVIREVYEETGYQVNLNSSTPFFMSETNFYHNVVDKFYHSVNVYFSCSLLSDYQELSAINNAVPDEITKVEWVSLDNLNEEDIYPFHYPAIQRLRQI